jgi:hypothetical protein
MDGWIGRCGYTVQDRVYACNRDRSSAAFFLVRSAIVGIKCIIVFQSHSSRQGSRVDTPTDAEPLRQSSLVGLRKPQPRPGPYLGQFFLSFSLAQ